MLNSAPLEQQLTERVAISYFRIFIKRFLHMAAGCAYAIVK
jgi:hypothetical protein